MTALVAVCLILAFLLFLLNFLYNHFWNRNLTADIHFREPYAVEEERAVLQEVIVNDKWLPLPVVEINFHMGKGLRFTEEANTTVSDQSYRRDVFTLAMRQKITRTLEFRCVKRGYYRIDEAGLMAQNLLMTRKYISALPQNTEFFVFPKPVETSRIQIPFSRIMGSVLSRRKIYDDPFEFAGIREYSRSDPMKYINWKATARTGEMLVNMHESTLSQKVVLLLDLEGLGVPRWDVLNETAVCIACSLCERLLAAGVEIGVVSNGTDSISGKPLRVDSAQGTGSMLFLRKKFACLQAGNQLAPLHELLEAQRLWAGERKQEGGSLYVLISKEQGKQTAEDLSALAGKQSAVQIVPYLEEFPPEPEAPNNVQLLPWLV